MTDHIFCRGSARGFTHDAFEMGYRVALTFYAEDYWRGRDHLIRFRCLEAGYR